MLLGYYCETSELSSVTGQCQAGYYCVSGALRPDPQDDATGGLCPMGAYCPSGTDVPIMCSPGYYTNATGNTDATDCKECVPGKFYTSNMF